MVKQNYKVTNEVKALWSKISTSFCFFLFIRTHIIEIHHWRAASSNDHTWLMSFAGWLCVAMVTDLLESGLQAMRIGDREGSVEL